MVDTPYPLPSATSAQIERYFNNSHFELILAMDRKISRDRVRDHISPPKSAVMQDRPSTAYRTLYHHDVIIARRARVKIKSEC